jgi:hypothetical protein
MTQPMSSARAIWETPTKRMSDRVRDQKIRILIRSYQKGHWTRPSALSHKMSLQLIPLMEPELLGVANCLLRAPYYAESFEEAWESIVFSLGDALRRYNLKTMPNERLPLQLSFLFLELLRDEQRERDLYGDIF